MVYERNVNYLGQLRGFKNGATISCKKFALRNEDRSLFCVVHVRKSIQRTIGHYITHEEPLRHITMTPHQCGACATLSYLYTNATAHHFKLDCQNVS